MAPALAAALLWTLVAPVGCTSVRQPVPTRAQVESSLPGYRASDHFMERLRQRNVSYGEVLDAVRHGERFYDPKNDSIIRWKAGTYVALTRDGVIKTVIRGPIDRRWRPAPGPVRP